MSKQEAAQSGNIKVVCRVRPFNKTELELGSASCVEFLDNQSMRVKLSGVSEKGDSKQVFNFDRVFGTETKQEEIYEFAAKPVVLSVLEGFNGTVFAYGQTSSGKTFTMQGASIDDEKLKGVIPRMVETVFEHISDAPDHIEFRIKIAIVEIYMEKIKDLLDGTKGNLLIREDRQRGVYIQDVTEMYVSSQQEVFDLMRIGNQNRAVTATNMNQGSSRSHMIFMLTVSQNNLLDLSAKTGKLFLVDLAGSEKVGKTGAEGRVLDEAKMINQSLSCLGNVINALTDNKSTHIPYRNSKLTRVLQESIGGNSRTTLIVTCSPSPFNDFETLSTLRFGIRAKDIKNKAKINREITVAELQILLAKAQAEIEEKRKRILQLEKFIKESGQQAPKVEEQVNELEEKLQENTQEEGEGQENNRINNEFKEDNLMEKIHNVSSIEAGKNMKVGSSIESNADWKKEEEKLREMTRSLEEELENERSNVTVQAEKLSILRKEFTKVTTKCLAMEKENQSLLQKLANSKMQADETRERDFEERLNVFEQRALLSEQRVAELEKMEELRYEQQEQIQGLQKEIEDLKAGRELLQSKLEEQNEEFERKDSAKKASFFLEEQGEAERFIVGLKGENKQLKEAQKRAKAFIKTLVDSGDDRIKKQAQDFEESEGKASQASTYEPEQQIFESLKTKIQFLEGQLLGEKRYGQDLFKQLRTVREEKKQLVVNMKEEINQAEEEMEKKILSVKEECEKRVEKITGDLQNRVNKVIDLEMKLDEGKEREDRLLGMLSSDDKSKFRKIDSLQDTIKDLTKLYYEQQSVNQNWKQDATVSDCRLVRKNERIIELENEISRVKDELILTQQKFEQFKKTFDTKKQSISDYNSLVGVHSMQKHAAKTLIVASSSDNNSNSSPANYGTSHSNNSSNNSLRSQNLRSSSQSDRNNSFTELQGRGYSKNDEIEDERDEQDKDKKDIKLSGGDIHIVERISFSSGSSKQPILGKVVKPLRGGGQRHQNSNGHFELEEIKFDQS